MREALLTVHVLAIIVWIGFGLLELYIGRQALKAADTPAEAPLFRIAYQSDLWVFIATLTAFAAGAMMTHVLDWGWFTHLWLGAKQAIMIAVLVVVAIILPRALRMGGLIAKLAPGPGPASAEIRGLYRGLEPWYWLMRLLAIAAVVLAIWRPE
jgi:uncharacterized membrane protein